MLVLKLKLLTLVIQLITSYVLALVFDVPCACDEELIELAKQLWSSS